MSSSLDEGLLSGGGHGQTLNSYSSLEALTRSKRRWLLASRFSFFLGSLLLMCFQGLLAPVFANVVINSTANDDPCERSLFKALTSYLPIVLVGVGMVGFGWLFDTKGLRLAMISSLGLMVGGTLMLLVTCFFTVDRQHSPQAQSYYAFTLLVALWLAIISLGVGGSYVTAAMTTSLFTHSYWSMALTFQMQGVAAVATPVVLNVAIQALCEDAFSDDGGSIDLNLQGCYTMDIPIWKIVLSGPAVLGCLVLLYIVLVTRFRDGTVPVERYLQTDSERQYRQILTGSKETLMVLLRRIFLRRWVYLGAAALPWMLFDWAFYGNHIFDRVTSASVDRGSKALKVPTARSAGVRDPDYLQNISLHALWLPLAATPGYFVALMVTGKYSQRMIQTVGFMMVAVFYLIMTIVDVSTCADRGFGFVLLVIATYIACQAGPNTTTFVITSDLVPEEGSAGLFFGLAAASGKLGAFGGKLCAVQLETLWKNDDPAFCGNSPDRNATTAPPPGPSSSSSSWMCIEQPSEFSPASLLFSAAVQCLGAAASHWLLKRVKGGGVSRRKKRGGGGGGGAGGGGQLNADLELDEVGRGLLQDLEEEDVLVSFALIRKGRKFAAGGSGQLYHGEFSGCRVALKELFGCLDGTGLSELAHETKMLRRLNHPHIVRFFGISLFEGSVYIITEFCAGGDLSTFIADAYEDEDKGGAARIAAESKEVLPSKWKRKRKVDVEQLVKMATQISSALEFIHSRDVVHRDLKPANILLTAVGGGDCKICDLGISRLVGTNTTSGSTIQQTQTLEGTPMYMPPEVAAQESLGARKDRSIRYNGRKWDIYSCGLVFLELLTGLDPEVFVTLLDSTDASVQQAIAVRARIPEWLVLDPEWITPILGDMISMDPTDRPGFGEVTGRIRRLQKKGSLLSLQAMPPV